MVIVFYNKTMLHHSGNTMESNEIQSLLDTETLLKIISIQTEVIQEVIELEKITFLVARKAQEIISAEGAVIEFKEGTEMVYRATSGIADAQLGLRLDFEHSLSGLCVKERKPQICMDSEIDPRVDKIACRKVGLRSMIVVPLIHKGNVIGALKVLSSKANAFGERDVAIIEILSNLISASLYIAERFDHDELYIHATTDAMTGIKNRGFFYDQLRTTAITAQEKDEPFGVFITDIDNLKYINDTYGHHIGDLAIIEIVNRVRSALRTQDTFCRLGGDEFGILVPVIKNEPDMITLMERITKVTNTPCTIESIPLELSMSIGFSLFPVETRNIQELIELADKRMYEVKRNKKKVRSQVPAAFIGAIDS